MEEKQTKYGKTFTGKFESSRSKFRKDHVELTVNLKFLQKFLKKKSKWFLGPVTQLVRVRRS